MLRDVPPVTERIGELAVPVAPEHVGRRLAHLRAGRYRLGEHCLGVGVGDVEGKHDRSAADRGQGKHVHLGELISDVQHAISDAQLDRHEPAVRDKGSCRLLRAERVAVELSGPRSALDHDVSTDRHAGSVRPAWFLTCRRPSNPKAKARTRGLPGELRARSTQGGSPIS